MIYIFLFILLIVIDQYTKILASKYLINSTIEVIPNFFELLYLENRGAGFGILQGKFYFFMIVTIIITIVILYYIVKNKDKLSKCHTLIYIILLAGIYGNAYDRIFRGYVIDFLSFDLYFFKFPVFNIADILISFSCITLIVLTFIEEKKDKKNVKF